MHIFAGKLTADDIRGAFPGAAINVIMKMPRSYDPEETNTVLLAMLDDDRYRDYMIDVINRSPLETTREFDETYLKPSTQVLIDSSGVRWLRQESKLPQLIYVKKDPVVGRIFTDDYLNAQGDVVPAADLLAHGSLRNAQGDQITLDHVRANQVPFCERDYGIHMIENFTAGRGFLSDEAPTYPNISHAINVLHDDQGREWTRDIVTKRHGILRRKAQYAPGEWTCAELGQSVPVINLMLGTGYLIEPVSGRMTDGGIGNLDMDLVIPASMAV